MGNHMNVIFRGRDFKMHPVINDVVLFFEMHRYINHDVMRCSKCVMFEKLGLPATEYPSNITCHISAILVDSDECQKAKTVNTSICNEGIKSYPEAVGTY